MIPMLLDMLLASAATPESAEGGGLERALIIIGATIALPFIVWGLFRIPYLVAAKCGRGRSAE